MQQPGLFLVYIVPVAAVRNRPGPVPGLRRGRRSSAQHSVPSLGCVGVGADAFLRKSQASAEPELPRALPGAVRAGGAVSSVPGLSSVTLP